MQALVACGLDIMFITWKEIYLLLKILGTVGRRGKQREGLCLEIVGVCVRPCLLRCVSAYVCIYREHSVHTHPSIYTRGMFLVEVGVVSWPNEKFQGYVNEKSLRKLTSGLYCYKIVIESCNSFCGVSVVNQSSFRI